MSATTAVPTTVSPEAAARVAELGLQREFEQNLDFVRQMPGLAHLRVEYRNPYDTGCSEIILCPEWEPDSPSRKRAVCQWVIWVTATFPPEVMQYFFLDGEYHQPHEWSSVPGHRP